MTRAQHERRGWIHHGYYRTYEIASRLESIAVEPFNYIRELESLIGDNELLSFFAPWQKETLIHRFARWIANDMFNEDTAGPYDTHYVHLEDGGVKAETLLPVDLALESYGISDGPKFVFPEPITERVHVERNIYTSQVRVEVQDAAYEYQWELSLSQPYENLLTQIANEVFHVVFHNRMILFGLNAFLARLTRGFEVDSDDFPEESGLFTKGGTLRRKSIPTWVRRAVLFRDYGHCVSCGVDLSGTVSSLPNDQFDHMVPLAQGGLNDITNIQLLCHNCNNKKSSRAWTNSRYVAFFEH